MNKVLIVDDEPFYREAIKKIINWKELQLSIPDEAINGLDAIEKIKSNYYEIIITDIKMPKMDGVTLIREATLLSPKSCFIVLSAYDEFAFVKEAFKLGIIDYILKHQISQEELMRVIQHYRQQKNRKQVDERVFTHSILINILNGIVPEKDVAHILSIPPADKGGRIYPAKGQFHSIKPDLRSFPLDFDIISNIEEELCSRFSNLYIEKGRRLSFFLISKTNLSWKELDSFWGEVLKFWQSGLKDFEYSLSIGFNHNSNSFSCLKNAMSEAETCLDWFISRGKGMLLSPPKIIIDKGSLRSLPSTENLSRGLVQLSSEESSQALVEMKINKNDYRSTDPEMLKVYYKSVNAHIVSAMETMKLTENNDLKNLLSAFNERSGWDLDDYNNYLEGIGTFLLKSINLSNKQIADIVGYLQKNYSRELTLSEVAEKFNLNGSYLSRLFKKEMGIGFSNYLAQIRIKKAESLFDTGQIKVSEVGRIVGIPQPETFCRTFKRIAGMSPQEYLYSKCKKLTN